jgi:hypothetical protein
MRRPIPNGWKERTQGKTQTASDGPENQGQRMDKREEIPTQDPALATHHVIQSGHGPQITSFE